MEDSSSARLSCSSQATLINCLTCLSLPEINHEPTMDNNNKQAQKVNRQQASTCRLRTSQANRISRLQVNLSSSSTTTTATKIWLKRAKLKHRPHRPITIPVPISSIFCYSSSLLAIWFLILNCASKHTPAVVESARLPDIYWNSSNPIFRIDNTDHIFDVNKKQHDHDQVDLVCPSSSSSSPSTMLPSSDPAGSNKSSQLESGSQERYIIYSVSKEEYDTCRLNSNQARVVAVCDQQANGKNRPPITVTFRSFTPQPNGLEFKAGQDYYFISALIGHHSEPQKRFSPCREQNMKVIFKVCCKSAGSSQQVTPNRPTTQVSILPANNNNLASQRVSTRRPPVITLRPSLPSQPASQQQQQQQQQSATSMVNEYLRSLAPNYNPSSQQQQAPQPITVLPIEVLQPSSSESSSFSSSSTTVQPDSMESERNDIVQNEQQPSTPTPTPANFLFRQPPQAQQPRPAVEAAQQNPIFLRFDPTAPPDSIRSRYQPTPLPANLVGHQKQPSSPSSIHQVRLSMVRPTQVNQPEPELWQLPAENRRQAQQQQPASSNHHIQMQPQQRYPSGQVPVRGDQSRIVLYPNWQTYDQPAPPRDLITVLDQQQASSGSVRASSLALVPCLLVLALIGLYLNRARRAQLASIR